MSMHPTRLLPVLGFAALLSATCAWAQIDTEWLYHAAPDADPAQELVPGETFPFLDRGPSADVDDNQPITLYLLTRQNFAGDAEEQVYLRWWDGYMSHWIMGSWVKNIRVSPDDLRFRGCPADGASPVFLDLWRIEIPAWITQPGHNYYAIQAKAWRDGHADMRYLLARPGGDFGGTNPLGQAWSASEDFEGQDWLVNVTGE